MAAFILSTIVRRYVEGQRACTQAGLVSVCLEQLEDSNPVLRQWLAICLGCVWEACDDARWHGVRDNAHEKLYKLLWDEIPEVTAHTPYSMLHTTYSILHNSMKSSLV